MRASLHLSNKLVTDLLLLVRLLELVQKLLWPLDLADPVFELVAHHRLLHDIRKRVEHGVAGRSLGHGLVNGVVAHEAAFAVGDDVRVVLREGGVAHCVVAGDFLSAHVSPDRPITLVAHEVRTMMLSPSGLKS